MVKVRIFLSVLFATLIGFVPAIAQPSKPAENPMYFPTEWAWTKEKWTGDDKPYMKIRQRIDNAIAHKQSADALSRQYAKRAAANPSDPQSQFAWGYAAVMVRKPGTYVGRQIPMAISKALATASSPKSYQYARMRYMMLMTWGTWLQLKDLGNKLVERDSSDILVKRHLVRILSLGSSSERQRAMVYANQVVSRYPNSSFSYGTLGGVYRQISRKEKNIDADYKAISAYKRALSLNPSPEVKDDLEYSIKTVNKRILRYKRQ